MTIHADHPFADPDPDPARRLRGRLGGRVTLWTTGTGAGRAGLTVSSVMIAVGEPSHVLALVDPDSDLATALEDSGTAVVHLLGWRHRDLADMFAGLTPAPGGVFNHSTWVDSRWGPVLTDVDGWAGVSLVPPGDQPRRIGYSWLVTGEIEELTIGADTDPLFHRRGRYERPHD